MSGPNRSSAVMAQRHEALDSLDDFPTPPWATRAFLEWAKVNLALAPASKVREPAANRGHMVKVLEEVFSEVEASDIHDYSAGYPLRDFLRDDDMLDNPTERVALTCTNPPFNLAEDFARRGLDTSDHLALLLRVPWLEGEGRYKRLFVHTPPSDVLFFCERVVMWKGVLLDPDVPILNTKKDGTQVVEKPTTATAYAWFVWRRGANQKCYDFIPPGTRARLTRPGDYPPVPEHLRPHEAEPAPVPLLDGGSE